MIRIKMVASIDDPNMDIRRTLPLLLLPPVPAPVLADVYAHPTLGQLLQKFV
jgi:hypothetical protein